MEIFETDVETGKLLYTGRYKKTDDGYVKTWDTRVLGWDPGRRLDSAGICILDKCKDGIYRIVGVTCWKNVEWPTQRKYIEKLCKDLKVDILVFDANGPGSTEEETLKMLDNKGEPMYPYVSSIKIYPIYAHTREFKINTYRKMKKLMTEGKFKLPRHTKMVDHFAALTVDMYDKVTHKKGTDIDIASAIMVASSVFFNPKNKLTKGSDFKVYFVD